MLKYSLLHRLWVCKAKCVYRGGLAKFLYISFAKEYVRRHFKTQINAKRNYYKFLETI